MYILLLGVLLLVIGVVLIVIGVFYKTERKVNVSNRPLRRQTVQSEIASEAYMEPTYPFGIIDESVRLDGMSSHTIFKYGSPDGALPVNLYPSARNWTARLYKMNEPPWMRHYHADEGQLNEISLTEAVEGRRLPNDYYRSIKFDHLDDSSRLHMVELKADTPADAVPAETGFDVSLIMRVASEPRNDADTTHTVLCFWSGTQLVYSLNMRSGVFFEFNIHTGGCEVRAISRQLVPIVSGPTYGRWCLVRYHINADRYVTTDGYGTRSSDWGELCDPPMPMIDRVTIASTSDLHGVGTHDLEIAYVAVEIGKPLNDRWESARDLWYRLTPFMLPAPGVELMTTSDANGLSRTVSPAVLCPTLPPRTDHIVDSDPSGAQLTYTMSSSPEITSGGTGSPHVYDVATNTLTYPTKKDYFPTPSGRRATLALSSIDETSIHAGGITSRTASVTFDHLYVNRGEHVEFVPADEYEWYSGTHRIPAHSGGTFGTTLSGVRILNIISDPPEAFINGDIILSINTNLFVLRGQRIDAAIEYVLDDDEDGIVYTTYASVQLSNDLYPYFRSERLLTHRENDDDTHDITLHVNRSHIVTVHSLSPGLVRAFTRVGTLGIGVLPGSTSESITVTTTIRENVESGISYTDRIDIDVVSFNVRYDFPSYDFSTGTSIIHNGFIGLPERIRSNLSVVPILTRSDGLVLTGQEALDEHTPGLTMRPDGTITGRLTSAPYASSIQSIRPSVVGTLGDTSLTTSMIESIEKANFRVVPNTVDFPPFRYAQTSFTPDASNATFRIMPEIIDPNAELAIEFVDTSRLTKPPSMMVDSGGVITIDMTSFDWIVSNPEDTMSFNVYNYNNLYNGGTATRQTFVLARDPSTLLDPTVTYPSIVRSEIESAPVNTITPSGTVSVGTIEGDIFTLSAHAAFTINANTGDILVNLDLLDLDTQRVYELRVTYDQEGVFSNEYMILYVVDQQRLSADTPGAIPRGTDPVTISRPDGAITPDDNSVTLTSVTPGFAISWVSVDRNTGAITVTVPDDAPVPVSVYGTVEYTSGALAKIAYDFTFSTVFSEQDFTDAPRPVYTPSSIFMGEPFSVTPVYVDTSSPDIQITTYSIHHITYKGDIIVNHQLVSNAGEESVDWGELNLDSVSGVLTGTIKRPMRIQVTIAYRYQQGSQEQFVTFDLSSTALVHLTESDKVVIESNATTTIPVISQFDIETLTLTKGDPAHVRIDPDTEAIHFSFPDPGTYFVELEGTIVGENVPALVVLEVVAQEDRVLPGTNAPPSSGDKDINRTALYASGGTLAALGIAGIVVGAQLDSK